MQAKTRRRLQAPAGAIAVGQAYHVLGTYDGTTQRLYVNGAKQACLVVNDLKHGESRGQIALWTRISSEAYFANLQVETK